MAELTRIAIDGADYQIALPDKETDYIQGKIAKEGAPYEAEMLKDMTSRLHGDDLVLDVGANIGNHTLYLAAVVGCRVLAFEPNMHLCRALEESIEVNALSKRVKLYCVGVGSDPGKARFSHLDQANLGAQSIEVAKDGDIDVIRLDDLEWDEAVRAIKVDVEGMEMAVLHGAERLIRRDHPYLYVECQSYEQYREVQTWLKRFGYGYIDTFNATPTHLFVHLDSVDEDRRLEHIVEKIQALEYSLKPELLMAKRNLHGANIKYRKASENILILKEKLDEKKKLLDAREDVIKNQDEKLKGAREKWEMMESDLKEGSHKERAALKEQVDTLKELLERESRVRQEDRAWLVATHEADLKRLEQVGEKLEAAEERLAENSHKVKILLEELVSTKRKSGQLLKFHEEKEKQTIEDYWDVARLETLLEETVRQNNILQHELGEEQKKYESVLLVIEKYKRDATVALKEKSSLELLISEANQKYRNATAHQIPALKAKMAQQEERTRELQQRAVQLNQDLKQAKQQRAEALRSLSELKSSLTFKAGLHFRAASHSFTDALKLPVRLWRLRRQVKSGAGGQPLVNRETTDTTTVNSLPASEALGSRRLNTQVLVDKPAKQVRVACIMDDFTFGSYQPECDLHQLTPEHWAAELEACQPELLFIESAWRGKEQLWGSKVGHNSQELQGIVAWCRERYIPTIFWNKEDPVHFETFLNTARLFDFVFTTDIDCIHRYKAALGHERVYFLPFACQPAVHNPIEKYERKDAFCFAGAYYVRYPERTRDLESFVQELPSLRPLEIYDRNYGKSDPNYQFPDAYQPHIVGTLPFEEIGKAYKGYRYAINLNSIKQSQTMFARRVYELLGSNTLTVSNFSRGVRLMFGDLVVTSDSGAEVRRRLEQLEEEGSIDRLRLAGVRKVMREHTYAKRFAYVLSKVSGREVSVPLPSFKVLATASTVQDVALLVAHVERQTGVEVSLTVVLRRGVSMAQAEATVASAACRVELLPAKALRRKQLSDLAGEASWIAGMLPQDYYGGHYLLDIALATRYSDAQVIGKAAYHSWQHGECELHDADESYRPANHLMARRAAITVSAAELIRADKWLAGTGSWSYGIPGQLAIDAYSYCENGAEGDIDRVIKAVDDIQINVGTSVKDLVGLAESVAPMESSSNGVPYLDGRELVHLLSGKSFTLLTGHEPREDDGQGDGPVKLTRNKALTFSLQGSVLEIGSELPDGKHEYVYAAKDIDCKVLTERLKDAEPGAIPLYMEVDPGLNLSLVVLFLDANKQRIGHVIEQPNRNKLVVLPEGTAFVRFGLRIYAGGNARIKRLLLGHLDLEPENILGQSDVLLLTNHYPSYDDLYRNGFVHSRVKAYKERGVEVDVFRFRKDQAVSWHEFQDVDVITGSPTGLRRMLESGKYRHVLVHFLDADMWEVLGDFIDEINVTVWVHGAEIQPWWRREYNYIDENDLELAKAQSAKRLGFWQELLNPMPERLSLVFVSHYFAEEVMADVGLKLPENQYRIIHNPVDTELFSYIEKPPEQRKKILSIRPYASRKYANDLSVKAVIELSKEPFFNELEFLFIGDGVLFDETLLPLRKFPNVVIERGFLSQFEIAKLHKEFGVFLCPTRMDAQGVSKDEAMASGLVVVTNGVTAIPEFVDSKCGILAAAENYSEIFSGLKMLYLDPSLFGELSNAAYKRANSQVSKEKVVVEELKIFEVPDGTV